MVIINGKRRTKEDWLIISRQTYFRTTFHKRQQMLLRSSFIKKGGNLFADHKFNCSACQTSKRMLSLQRKRLNAFSLILWHFSVMSRRKCAHQLYAGQTSISTVLMSLERRGGMKHRRLIETKSTPCLWAAILLAEDTYCGNYSAGEHQSLKIMCNHRLEPDIKRQSHHIWLTKASL